MSGNKGSSLGSQILDNKGHIWQPNPDGTADTVAVDWENHNGPVCLLCGYVYCALCHSEPPEACRITAPTPELRVVELL